MIVASCPACHEPVTVPIDASPSSLVRCPLCNAEFQLGAFLSQLPPPLIVVQEQRTSPVGESAQPAVPSDSGVLPLDAPKMNGVAASPAADGSLPAFDFTPGSAPAPQSGRAREAARRPARPPKNMAWEIAKIVGGGLLAIPAAQAILWWCVPRDWQRDLLGIGPAISRVAPWIVPFQFRDLDAQLEPDDANSDEARWNQRDDSALTAPPTTPRLAAKPNDRTAPRDVPGRAAHKMGGNATPRAGQEPAVKVPPGEPASAPTRPGDPAASPATEPSGDTSVSPVADQPKTAYQAEDLRVALEQALQASVDWDTSPDQSEEHRAELTEAFYQAFTRLGEVLFALSRDDPQGEVLLKDLSALLESFARQPKKLAMIGNRGQSWLAQTTRANSGVFLFGTVRATSPFGSLFATELDLAAMQKRVVTVISPGDPLRFYDVGDRILILGKVVPPPADVVAAAPQGETPETFVWGSLPVSLGK